MKFNRSVILSFIPLIFLLGLIAHWLMGVYDRKVENIQSETNALFLESLQDAEENMIVVMKMTGAFEKEPGTWMTPPHGSDTINTFMVQVKDSLKTRIQINDDVLSAIQEIRRSGAKPELGRGLLPGLFH